MRRTPFALVALATAAVLTGCGPGGTPSQTGSPTAVVPAPASAPAQALPPVAPSTAPTTTVMIIRHGEKPDDDLTGAAAKGVDANGVEDDSSLTAVGWDRAHRLVDLFDPAGDVKPGLARPATIYAAGANEDGEGKRTRETVAPLAEKLGLPVNTGYGKGDEEKLVEHVVAQPGPTLISWQHGEIPSIADAFPGVTPTPPSEWPDDRFDVVWVLTKADGAWHFSQVPELVLPQDKPTVLTEDD